MELLNYRHDPNMTSKRVCVLFIYFGVFFPAICKKAARQFNVHRRIGKHLDRFGKLTIYHSFIMSNSSYCPLT